MTSGDLNDGGDMKTGEMNATNLPHDLVLGDGFGQPGQPGRLDAARAAKERINQALDGIEAVAALDGLISAWLSLAVTLAGLDATRGVVLDLVVQLDRVKTLSGAPQGSA